MKINLKLLLQLCLIILFLILPGIIFAKGPGGPGGPGDPCTDPYEYCPIDGGVGALLAAGIGYGIKKVRDIRRESSGNTEKN